MKWLALIVIFIASAVYADEFDTLRLRNSGLVNGDLVGSDANHQLVDATPQPTSTPPNTPVPTATARPTDTPQPTATPANTPVSTATAVSTPTPRATDTPAFTPTPRATDTPAPTSTPELPLPNYAVTALPVCNGGAQYHKAFVNDATGCVFNTAPTGGSTTVCPVFCDGASWLEG